MDFDYNNILKLLFYFAEMIIFLKLLYRIYDANSFLKMKHVEKYLLMAGLICRYFLQGKWLFIYPVLFLCVLTCCIIPENRIDFLKLTLSLIYPFLNMIMSFSLMTIINYSKVKSTDYIIAVVILLVLEVWISNYLYNAVKVLKRNPVLKSDIQHDFNNHLSTIAILAKQNKNEEITEYVKRMRDLHDLSNTVITGNEKLDALLGLKFKDALKYHIVVERDIAVPCDFEFDIFDLTVLLGNAFDNAINALNQLKVPEKKIGFKMKYSNNRLFIEMRNQYLAHEEEGVGMKNMEVVVSKYNGLLNMEYEENEAVLTVLLFFDF